MDTSRIEEVKAPQHLKTRRAHDVDLLRELEDRAQVRIMFQRLQFFFKVLGVLVEQLKRVLAPAFQRKTFIVSEIGVHLLNCFFISTHGLHRLLREVDRGRRDRLHLGLDALEDLGPVGLR